MTTCDECRKYEPRVKVAYLTAEKEDGEYTTETLCGQHLYEWEQSLIQYDYPRYSV